MAVRLDLGLKSCDAPSTDSSIRLGGHPGANSPTRRRFFEDFGIWKEAPVLKGSTQFEPLPDVKNIMITGGAGFM